MNASVPIPFALGDPVWAVGPGHRTEWVTCPECAGTKTITMTLGNGEEYLLKCEGCSRGYEPASGVIERTVYEHKPSRFIPRRVQVDGDEIRYSTSGPDATCYGTVNARDLFISEAECQAACHKRNAGQAAEEEKRVLWNFLDKRRKMAWSVHYWRQKISQLEKDLEWMRARLVTCQERKPKAAEPTP